MSTRPYNESLFVPYEYMGAEARRVFDASMRLEVLKMFNNISTEEYNRINQMIFSDDSENLTVAELLLDELFKAVEFDLKKLRDKYG